MSHIRPTEEQISTVLEDWKAAIMATYPLDTVGFLRVKKDQFQNPVGERIQRASAVVVGALLGKGRPVDEVDAAVDDIVRIRAVQDFTPAKAVGVFLLLKGVLRKTLLTNEASTGFYREFLELESRVDGLLLKAVDVYAACREKLAEMRIAEVKRLQAMLIRKAGLVCDPPADEPEQ